MLSFLIAHFDAVLFSETGLTSDDGPPSFDNYTCRMLHLNIKTKGCGAAVYLREGLSCHVVENFSIINPDIESLLLHLEKVLVVLLYRPPTGDKSAF